MEVPKVGEKWKPKPGFNFRTLTITRLDPLNNRLFYIFDDGRPWDCQLRDFLFAFDRITE